MTDQPTPAPPVVGLAGGIGSGKSALASALDAHGWLVIDFDAEARRALDLPEVRAEIRAAWGDAVFALDGSIDRARLADRVFTHPDQRERLEAIVHPRILPSRDDLARRVADAGARGVVLDAPLLFETGLDRLCDLCVFIDAPPEDRRRRVAQTRGWTPGELARRESAQWPIERKRAACALTIRNSGDIADLDVAAREIAGMIEGERRGRPGTDRRRA